MTLSCPAVTVIVPCFNEQAGVPALLARLRAMRSDQRVHDWHFLFVDDGSTDGTFAELLRARRDEPWIGVARHQEQLGLGAALRTGFAQVMSPVVCSIDSDCAFPPERLPELTAALAHGAEIVTASAACGDAAAIAENACPLPLRRALSRLYPRLIGQDVSALTCLLRAYDRRVIQRIRFRANGFSAVGEILLRAVFAGHRVREVPMVWEPRRSGASRLTAAEALLAHLHWLTLAALAVSARQARRALRRIPSPGAPVR